MNIANLTIEIIPVKRLVEFSNEIESDPVKYSIAPIDPFRARAHAKNPLASNEDPGMVVAYAEGKCIGYVGMMPMLARIGEEIRKVLAPTTQFVHPDYRKKSPDLPGTVADIMYKASFETGMDQMITGFNEAGERIYLRRPEWFIPLSSLKYLRVKLTPLQPVESAIRRTSLLLGRTGKAGKSGVLSLMRGKFLPDLLGSILKVKDDSPRKNLLISETKQIPEDTRCNFQAHTRPCFPRPPAVINWMINNPWHETSDDLNPRYHFHNPRQRFGYFAYNVLNSENRNVGYFVLYCSTERLYTTVKILDYNLSLPDAEAKIWNLAIERAIALGANQVEGGIEFLPLLQSSKLLGRLTEVFERKYFMYLAPDSPFRGQEQQIAVHYCDGERPFI